MAKSTIVTVVHLIATNKDARDKLLEGLHSIAEYSKIKEPGILKYAICVPDDVKDETSIYAIEEYVDKETYDSHMTIPPVVAFLESLKQDPPLLSPDTKTYTVSWVTTAILSRTDRLPDTSTAEHDLRNRVENPYVLWATITDPNQRDIDTLEPYGTAIVNYAIANEPDTIFYADARPKDLTPNNPGDDIKGGFICAVEVYANKEACTRHLQDESVKNLTVEGYKLGSKFEIVGMNMKEGWLTRA